MGKPKFIIAATVSTLSMAFLVLYIFQNQKKKKMSKTHILKNENVTLDGNLKEDKVEPQEPGLKPINCEESEIKTDEESNKIFQEVEPQEPGLKPITCEESEIKTDEESNKVFQEVEPQEPGLKPINCEES